jgi:aldose 1-epimerase
LSGKIILIQKKHYMKLFNIENTHGLKSRITNYGGRVVDLFTPDTAGHFDDIVLGYESLYGYLNSHEKYFGAIIGRYGNRIGEAKFEIDGKKYKLDANNGPNSLHGGNNGFHNVYWTITQLDQQTILMEYISEDMEEGFPGKLNLKVKYCMTDNNELKIEYFASTDKPTIVNLTHHSFFNLTGDFRNSINDHILEIPAEFYTPVDDELIPTGEIATVEGTPFDFRKPTRIGARVDENSNQLKRGNGYDHNWVLDADGLNKDIRLAAIVTEPSSGRIMEVYTNEPGIQFYSGNFLSGKDIGKNGIIYNYRTAFCLETQHFPDSPNKSNFPETLLNPGEEYYSICIYKFDTV